MKTNGDKIVVLLIEAINLCNEDSVLQEIKMLLKKALSLTQTVSKKRDRRQKTEEFRLKAEKDAREKQKKWLDLLNDAGKLEKK